MFAWMKLREGLLIDLNFGFSGNGRGLQLHDVGKIRQNFWRRGRRGGIDERLSRMGDDCWVGEDALARMEGVGAFGSEGIFWIAAGAWRRCFDAGKIQRRQIVDRAGPGELKIFQCGVFVGSCFQARPRQQAQHDVEEDSGNNCLASEAIGIPPVGKWFRLLRFLWGPGAGHYGAHTTGCALAEAAPTYRQLRALQR